MNKYQERAEKQKKKEIRRTLRRAKVDILDSYDEANVKLVKYVEKLKSSVQLYEVLFNSARLSDADFMMSIYRANPEATRMPKLEPKADNEALINNLDFMLEFVNIKYGSRHTHSEEKFDYLDLKWIVDDYRTLMGNPKFVTMLAEEYPDINVASLVKECTHRIVSWNETKQAEDEDIRYECMNNLPIELLQSQVKRYGLKYFYDLPDKHLSNHSKLVATAIEDNGFDALKYLHISEVLDNQDLIMQAYAKDGVDRLISYIECDLKPLRNRVYMCHGEPHDYDEYSQEYAEVQNTLKTTGPVATMYSIAKQAKEKYNRNMEGAKNSYDATVEQIKGIYSTSLQEIMAIYESSKKQDKDNSDVASSVEEGMITGDEVPSM